MDAMDDVQPQGDQRAPGACRPFYGLGVSLDSRPGTRVFKARLYHKGEVLNLGRFSDPHAARLAYDQAVLSMPPNRKRLKTNYPAGMYTFTDAKLQKKIDSFLHQVHPELYPNPPSEGGDEENEQVADNAHGAVLELQQPPDGQGQEEQQQQQQQQQADDRAHAAQLTSSSSALSDAALPSSEDHALDDDAPFQQLLAMVPSVGMPAASELQDMLLMTPAVAANLLQQHLLLEADGVPGLPDQWMEAAGNACSSENLHTSPVMPAHRTVSAPEVHMPRIKSSGALKRPAVHANVRRVSSFSVLQPTPGCSASAAAACLGGVGTLPVAACGQAGACTPCSMLALPHDGQPPAAGAGGGAAAALGVASSCELQHQACGPLDLAARKRPLRDWGSESFKATERSHCGDPGMQLAASGQPCTQQQRRLRRMSDELIQPDQLTDFDALDSKTSFGDLLDMLNSCSSADMLQNPQQQQQQQQQEPGAAHQQLGLVAAGITAASHEAAASWAMPTGTAPGAAPLLRTSTAAALNVADVQRAISEIVGALLELNVHLLSRSGPGQCAGADIMLFTSQLRQRAAGTAGACSRVEGQAASSLLGQLLLLLSKQSGSMLIPRSSALLVVEKLVCVLMALNELAAAAAASGVHCISPELRDAWLARVQPASGGEEDELVMQLALIAFSLST